MQIIIKNNRKYYRFKIGDEFSTISGKGSFNKMKKEGLCSDDYDEKQGFIYPFYDGSTINNHIKGYCKKYNFDGFAIKVAKDGAESGKTKFINGKSFNAGHSYYLISENYSNEYVSLLFSNYLPEFQQGTSIPSVKFTDYKEEYIEIPINHEKLSIVIKRILEYKQLSKQLSKQIKDYKLAILQESEKAIKHWKETGQKDKYITFKIGDEFSAISGKGSYNKMKKDGLCSDTYDEKQGFIYPFYDASTKNNHIKGYCKKYNYNGIGFKVIKDANPWLKSGGINKNNFYKPLNVKIKCNFSIYDELASGEIKLVRGRVFIGDHSFLMKSHLTNEMNALIMSKYIKSTSHGTNGLHSVSFDKIKFDNIILPSNHEKLSKKIEQLNNWQIKVEQTLKKMEEYIEGVLQQSLK